MQIRGALRLLAFTLAALFAYFAAWFIGEAFRGQGDTLGVLAFLGSVVLAVVFLALAFAPGRGNGDPL